MIGDLTLMGRLAGATEVKVEELTRVCTFPGGAVQHERISNYSPDQHSYDYAIEDGPLPVKNKQGRFAVQPAGDDSEIVWNAEFEPIDPSQEQGDERDVGRRDGPSACGYQRTDRDSMTKTTQKDAEALFNDISESFLGTPNVTTAKMFGGSALKVSNKVPRYHPSPPRSVPGPASIPRIRSTVTAHTATAPATSTIVVRLRAHEVLRHPALLPPLITSRRAGGRKLIAATAELR